MSLRVLLCNTPVYAKSLISVRFYGQIIIHLKGSSKQKLLISEIQLLERIGLNNFSSEVTTTSFMMVLQFILRF